MVSFQPAKLWGRDNPHATQPQAAIKQQGYSFGSCEEARKDFIQQEDMITVEQECLIQTLPYKTNADWNEEQISKRYNRDYQENYDNLEDEIDLWLDSIPQGSSKLKISNGIQDNIIDIEDMRTEPEKIIHPGDGDYSQKWSFCSDGTIRIEQYDYSNDSREKIILDFVEEDD